LGKYIYGRIRRHAVRQFWRTFEDDAHIMTTEYSIEPPPSAREGNGLQLADSKDQFIATHSTSGYFLSYGMAMALSALLGYLRKDLRSDVHVMGDKGHSQPPGGRDLIILGSPANNRYLHQFIDEHLAREFPLLAQFHWNVGDQGISITLPNGETLIPGVGIGDETGTDYALVMSVCFGRGRKQRIVAISGCNMWGTEAATRFLLDRGYVRSLPRLARRRRAAVAFLIRAWIANGRPDRIDLHPTSDGIKVVDLRWPEWPTLRRTTDPVQVGR